MDERAQVSVVIPTHNRAPLLEQAIRSVIQSELIATPDQIIVVDDASSDHTPEVAAGYGVRYLRVRCGGPSGTRNAGLAQVETPFVTFLDDDDCWLRGNLAPQLAALHERRDAAAAFGRQQTTYPDLLPYGPPRPHLPLPNGDAVEYALFDTPQLGTVLFRTDLAQSVGGFDRRIRYLEDVDFLVRMALRYPLVGVDFVGLLFRQRPWTDDCATMQIRGFRDYCLYRRGWRAAGMSRMLLLRADIQFRGKFSYWLCDSAVEARAAGRYPAAWSYLRAALRISPPHCLVRHRAFWKTLRALGTPALAGSSA